MISTMKESRHNGLPRGTRTKRGGYDPSSGAVWRPGSNFEPHNAMKLMSVAGFLNKLIEVMEVDPATGLPFGWPEAVRLKEAG